MFIGVWWESTVLTMLMCLRMGTQIIHPNPLMTAAAGLTGPVSSRPRRVTARSATPTCAWRSAQRRALRVRMRLTLGTGTRTGSASVENGRSTNVAGQSKSARRSTDQVTRRVPRSSFEAKQITHSAYERLRDPRTPSAEQRELEAFQRDVSANIPIPPGATQIPDYP